MSLTQISGQVSSITSGNGIGNFLSQTVFGNSTFLRNHERGIDKVTGAINDLQNIFSDLSSAAGIKDNMYVIGRYEEQEDQKDFLGRLTQPYKTAWSRAVSYWTGEGEQQQGVIIDGFDNFRGDISVALPDNPVMYQTSITDQVVHNPNRVSMRVYVDLMHTDDIIQNIIQTVANSFGGLAGTIMDAATGNKLNRAQKALEGLLSIQEYGRPFKVYTPHRVYDNMMIEKIIPINDQKMNEILAADITFKEIVLTQPLGKIDKTSARVAPSKIAAKHASLAGWLS